MILILSQLTLNILIDSELQDSEHIKLLDVVSVLRKYFTQSDAIENNYKIFNEIENQIYNLKFKNAKANKDN